MTKSVYEILASKVVDAVEAIKDPVEKAKAIGKFMEILKDKDVEGLVTTVKVKGRGKVSLDKFIEYVKKEHPGTEVYAVDTIEAAVRDADIVSVSTSSPTGDPSAYPYSPVPLQS